MFLEVLQSLNDGFLKSLEVFALTLIGAIPLGFIICELSKCSIFLIRSLVKAVIWVVRGTPLMLQLLVIYYGPGLIFGNNIWGGGAAGRLVAVLAAFIFNYSCYFAEIYRSGLEAVDRGQYEACMALGLSKWQSFFHVILLQAVKIIIPPMTNEIITLVKDTALARIIMVYEIIWAGQAFIKSKGIIWPLFFTGVYYLAMNGLLTVFAERIEKKLSYL